MIIVAAFCLAACEKTISGAARIEEAQICFQGRFIEAGCDGAAMVQIIEPLLDSLKESTYYLIEEDKHVDYSFATSIPETYQDGEIFYFRVKGNFGLYPHTTLCVWPKYSAEITDLSKDSCASRLTD